jgi:hypothetical protein
MRILPMSWPWVGIMFLLAFSETVGAQPGGIGARAEGAGGFGYGVAPQQGQYPPDRFGLSGVVLTGTVVREDGSPPPFGTTVEMDCGGEVARKTTADSNGHFSLQVDSDAGSREMYPDASMGPDQAVGTSGTFGRTNLFTLPGSPSQWNRRTMRSCELHALLHSYRSSVIRLSSEPGAGLNEIGTIVVHPYERMEGFTVSLATLMAPKAAQKSFELSIAAIQKGKFDEAERSLRSAVNEYPRYPEASYLLGEICERSQRTDEARSLYYGAIKADPMFAKAYLRLAKLAVVEKRWQEAADLSEKLLKLDPVALVECYFVNSLAHLNLNDMSLAEERALEGRRIDFSNQFPQFDLILAQIYAVRKDSAGAVRELRQYLQIAPQAPNASAVRVHLHELEHSARMDGE